MRYGKLILLFTAFAVLTAGCEALWKPKLDVQTFNLEHRSGYEAASIIQPYVFGDREEAPGEMSATEEAITVRETRDNLDKIGRVLEEFDRAIPGVRLYFQLIEADSFQGEDPAIADVVEELRSLFRFEGYRLIGEATVLLAGGPMGTQEFSQQFLGVENPITVQAEARLTSAGTVRMAPVRLADTWSQLMEATVSLTPGQTIVIGGTQARTGLVDGSPTGRTTLVLTVRAERD